ncbi:hypothetical protein Tco_0690989 [Tanacetum coccineum]
MERTKNMLTEKWTPMNANVQKFNQIVEETLVHIGENDDDWMSRMEIFFKTHTGCDFKHKSAWIFLKGKHKWKNRESTLARRRITDEEPKHFGEDALRRSPGLQRISKSQRDDLDIQNGHGLTLMSDQHKGLIEAVKEVMPLAASKASCPQIFIKIMDKINRSNPNARQYLLKKDLNTWSRAFFQEGSNCKAVENGFIECFNGVLLSVRHKPIITLLDSMRQTKDQQRFWHVIPSGGNKFEVKRGLDACKVDEKIFGPMKMPGRPRKKRIRAPNENKSTYKISRAGVEMTFHNCVEKGHNKKGCKNEPIPQTPKVPSKAGRPKKKVPIDTTNLVDEDDIPRFMNTKIDEYDRAASSNNAVFNNGRRIDLGMNWNKNKCGKSIGNSYVKVRR